MKDYNVLIELDCLLDTRLGTIYQMDKDLILPLLNKGYHNRLHNKLDLLNPDIDHKVFLENYAKRDINTLMVSRKTYLVRLLADYNKKDFAANYGNSDSLKRYYTINYHPYILTPKQINLYKEILEEVLETDTPVTMVSIPTEKLTIPYLTTNFHRLILFNPLDWMTFFESNKNGWRAIPSPAFEVTGSLIVRDFKAHEKTMEITKDGKDITIPLKYEDLAKQTSMALGYFIKLDFVKLGDMSIDMIAAKEEFKSGH